MERTSTNPLHRAPYRQVWTNRRGTGGVLLMARRRKARQDSLVIAIALALSLFACTLIFTGVRRVVASWRSEPPPQAAEPGVQVNAPLAAPAGVSRPIHILLLGSDQRGDDRSFRTDVIVLVTVDATNATASAVSFPRDLWVEPPTLYPMKINMIQAIGGFDAMAEMFATNFGVRPDYYVLTNFSGFTHLIDNLYGIDVQIGQSLSDSCDLPQAQGGICTVEPGTVHMDGPTALWYVRSRGSSSDFDRLRRAQEVVQAVFTRMMSPDALAHLPGYYQEFSQDLETNLTLNDITPLVPAAARLIQEPERIHRYVINEEQAYPSWSWDGMWILLPDPDAVRALLKEAGVLP